jgi:ATP-dependent Clp protease adapter protein ClpS
MSSTSRYSSKCGFFSAVLAVAAVTLLLIISSNNNNSCHAFMQPQHQIVLTARQIQLSQLQDHNKVGTSNRRNRFWGSPSVGRVLSLLQPQVTSSLHHHRRHGSRNAAQGVMVYSGPSILERPATTKEPSVKEEERVADKRQQHERYNETWEVRLYNDGLNTREHVSRSLVQVTGLSEYQAYHTMMQAHHNGMAVVGQYYYEIAEMFHDALKLEGIICDIVPVE